MTVEKNEIATPWSSIGYLVYKRTYARRLGESEDTEEFPQTVERVLTSAKTQFNCNFSEEEEGRLRGYMLALKGIVAGRFLWQCGTETVDRLGLFSLQNCAFVTVDAPVVPFTWAMDALALGSGVGFNIQRDNVEKIPAVRDWFKPPTRVTDAGADFIVSDSREGWVRLLAKTLKAAFLSTSIAKGTFTYSTMVVRGKGTPIKGFGGVASGPESLVTGINKISDVLQKRRGKKIRPIDALDIMNIIGEVIVAGNVRRSAMLAIGDCDDIEYLLAKNWSFGNIPSHRAMSNNSVACDDIRDLHEYFWKGYDGTGEPYGLINMKLSRKIGRLGETQYPDPLIQGYNPCAEQGLEPFETCCLATIFLPNIESEDEFKDVATLLYRVNKHSLQLSAHHPETDAVVKKNQRMGISITGILQASKEQLSWMNSCYEHLRDFDVRYSTLHGFNKSIKLTTVQPSGCSRGDTMLLTDRGILTLRELGDATGAQWQDHAIKVQQETITAKSTKFFVNGDKSTKLIVLDSGVELECTLDHKYRTLSMDGQYVWKTASELTLGDKLPYRVGGYDGDHYQHLKKVITFGRRSVVISQPDLLTEDLAYLLGAYYADGSTHSKGLRIAGNIDTKAENMAYLQMLANDIFGVAGRMNVREGTKNMDLYLTSQGLLRWFELNDLIKAKSHEIEFPIIVRKSPKSVVKAFIDGFFSGDGHLNRDTTTFCTTSKVFSQQLVIIMRAIGIDAKVKDMPPTASSLGTRMRYWVAERKGRSADSRYIKREMRDDWDALDRLGLTDFSVDKIASIVDSNCDTYDIEVPSNNTYLANSYVSHNTLSLLPGVVPGIHPGFAQYMYRRVRIASEHPLVAVCRSHGYPIEFQKGLDGKEDYGTVVVTFPFAYPVGTKLAKDMTAIDQLKFIKYIQENWSDNSVSCTVYYKKEELPEIKSYLEKHYKNSHKTLSFLLHSEHGFLQSPYEEITKEEFERLNRTTTLITSIDSADFESNDECAGGHCPIR
jgi:hypothetical protein